MELKSEQINIYWMRKLEDKRLNDTFVNIVVRRLKPQQSLIQKYIQASPDLEYLNDKLQSWIGWRIGMVCGSKPQYQGVVNKIWTHFANHLNLHDLEDKNTKTWKLLGRTFFSLIGKENTLLKR